MAKYIDAKELKRAVESLHKSTMDTQEILDLIDAQPAADVIKTRRAHPEAPVINPKYLSERCPECDNVIFASYHYCYQCGQKLASKTRRQNRATAKQ